MFLFVVFPRVFLCADRKDDGVLEADGGEGSDPDPERVSERLGPIDQRPRSCLHEEERSQASPETRALHHTHPGAYTKVSGRERVQLAVPHQEGGGGGEKHFCHGYLRKRTTRRFSQSFFSSRRPLLVSCVASAHSGSSALRHFFLGCGR